MIIPALVGVVGIIIGSIIAKFSEKSKANKILDATKKETNSLLKEAKIEAEALKKDKILQAKEKFIELTQVFPSPQLQNYIKNTLNMKLSRFTIATTIAVISAPQGDSAMSLIHI